MTNIKTDKYFVLSIARADFVRNYPSKYQRDTKEHPVFQAHLGGEDAKVFIVHESNINSISDEQDFIEPDDFFEFGDINKMTVESEDSEETADVWRDHFAGQPVGTTRDQRQPSIA
jgi:hypothetical protein